jgi:hypothetical protein
VKNPAKKRDVVPSHRVVDSSVVDPIRLGPDRLPAISLDISLGEIGHIAERPGPDLLEIRIDWPAALRIADFDSDEVDAFELVQLARCPRKTAAALLGWNPARLAAVAERLRRKVPQRLSALRAAVDQQIARAVPSLDLSFQQVMRDEHLRPTCQNEGLVVRNRGLMITKEKVVGIDEQLQAGRQRLSELNETLRHCKTLADNLQAELAKAEAAAKEENEQAVIEDRQPRPELVDAPGPLLKKFTQAERSVETTRGAVQRQSNHVTRIQGEIAAQARNRMLEKIRPLGVRARTLIEELAQIGYEITQASVPTGDTVFANDLFPPPNPSQCGDGQCERDLLARVITQATQLGRYRSVFTDGKGAGA